MLYYWACRPNTSNPRPEQPISSPAPRPPPGISMMRIRITSVRGPPAPRQGHETGDSGRPKAIIAPHAGYLYSGQVAATAFVSLERGVETIQRVVLIGPADYVPFPGSRFLPSMV